MLEHNLLAGILKGSEEMGKKKEIKRKKKNYPKITHPAYYIARRERNEEEDLCCCCREHVFIYYNNSKNLVPAGSFPFQLASSSLHFFSYFKNRREFLKTGVNMVNSADNV